MRIKIVFGLVLGCLAGMSWPSSRASAADAPAPVVLRVVGAASFWNMDARRGARAWSARELYEVRELARSAIDPAIRLRSLKLIVDQAGNGRFLPEQEDIALAGFRYLEASLERHDVRELCVDHPFTHYTIGSRGDGSTWFLIEHVEAGGASGGLNLKWDSEKKQIVEAAAWGSLAPN